MRKDVVEADTQATTHYMGSFQYNNNTLQYIHTAEGYVRHTPPTSGTNYGAFDYVYNYTDHFEDGTLRKCPVDIFSERARWRVGRLSYTLDPSDQVIKILEENHYYPFGMKHSYNTSKRDIRTVDAEIDLNGNLVNPTNNLTNFEPSEDIRRVRMVSNTGYQYKYNGKEYQDELGLAMYDYGARNYDPATGRWMNIDPLAEKYNEYTSYCYTLNNPIVFSDPDGKRVVWGEGLTAEQKMEIGAFIHNLRQSSEIFNSIFEVLHSAENEYSIGGYNGEDEDAALGAAAMVLPNSPIEIVGFDKNHAPLTEPGRPGAGLTFYFPNMKKNNLKVSDILPEEFVHIFQQHYYVGDGSFDYDKKDYGVAGEYEAKAIVGIIKKQAGLPYVKGASGWAEKKGNNYSRNPNNISNFKDDLKEWYSLPNLPNGYYDKPLNINYIPSLLINVLKK